MRRWNGLRGDRRSRHDQCRAVGNGGGSEYWAMRTSPALLPVCRRQHGRCRSAVPDSDNTKSAFQQLLTVRPAPSCRQVRSHGGSRPKGACTFDAATTLGLIDLKQSVYYKLEVRDGARNLLSLSGITSRGIQRRVHRQRPGGGPEQRAGACHRAGEQRQPPATAAAPTATGLTTLPNFPGRYALHLADRSI